jgi:hypothetical protein
MATNKKHAAQEAAAVLERAKREVGIIQKVIEGIETKLETEELKATVGDFIRLLQLRKELEEEQPREIEVTWIDSSEMESASEE